MSSGGALRDRLPPFVLVGRPCPLLISSATPNNKQELEQSWPPEAREADKAGAQQPQSVGQTDRGAGSVIRPAVKKVSAVFLFLFPGNRILFRGPRQICLSCTNSAGKA